MDSPYRVLRMGFDYKITPKDQIAIIEINGFNSGWEGFKSLYAELDLEAFRAKMIQALDNHLIEGGEIDDFFDQMDSDSDFAERVDKTEVGELKIIKRNSGALEGFLGNKRWHKEFIDPKNMAPWMMWRKGGWSELQAFIESLYLANTKNGNSSLLDMEESPFLVAKFIRGAHGEGVRIFDLRGRQEIPQELRDFLKESPGGIMIEGFVPSVEFMHPLNGTMHDACGRAFLEIAVDLSRERLRALLYANYLRLSPMPWSLAEFDEGMAKANLTGKTPAIPMKANRMLQEEVKEVVMATANKIVSSINHTQKKAGVNYL